MFRGSFVSSICGMCDKSTARADTGDTTASAAGIANLHCAFIGCSTKKLRFSGWRVPSRRACPVGAGTCQTVAPAPPIDKQSVAPLDVATFLCCTPFIVPNSFVASLP